jgi:hypothetical protein
MAGARAATSAPTAKQSDSEGRWGGLPLGAVPREERLRAPCRWFLDLKFIERSYRITMARRHHLRWNAIQWQSLAFIAVHRSALDLAILSRSDQIGFEIERRGRGW